MCFVNYDPIRSSNKAAIDNIPTLDLSDSRPRNYSIYFDLFRIYRRCHNCRMLNPGCPKNVLFKTITSLVDMKFANATMCT